MLGWIIVGIVFLCCVGVITFMLLQNNGRKIFIEIYEPRNGKPVRLGADKPIIGFQRRQDSVEKLFLPKKYSKFPIEGIDPNLFTDTDVGTPLIKLLRVSEGMFYPFKSQYDLDKKSMREIMEDRDVIPFYIEQEKRDQEKFDNSNPGFFEKYGPLISITFIVITGILAFYFINDHASQVYKDGLAPIQKSINEQMDSLENRENLLNNVIRYLISEGEIDAANFINTTADRPLGAGE